MIEVTLMTIRNLSFDLANLYFYVDFIKNKATLPYVWSWISLVDRYSAVIWSTIIPKTRAVNAVDNKLMVSSFIKVRLRLFTDYFVSLSARVRSI